MQRREFIRLGAGCLSAAALYRGYGRGVWPALPELRVRKASCRAGAARPFRVLHLSDSHLVRVDERDHDPRKVELASRRAVSFPWAEHYLDEAIVYARSHGCRLVHTGDVCDFVSTAGLEHAGRMFTADEWLACVGNHEFSKYVGEAKEDEAYKADSAEKVAAAYPNDIAFCSRVVNGVNFVAADNSYYRFAEDFVTRMRAEERKGLPIVLLCHVPPYVPGLFRENLSAHRGRCAYVCGAPDDLVSKFGQRDRIEQQRADDATKEAYAYLKSLNSLKAVLSGHVHRFWQERFSDSAVLFVASAVYKGEVQEVSFA